MTYFVAYGVLVHTLKDTIFNPTYRILKPHSVQIKEMEISNKSLPNEYEEFNFLTIEDGNSIYVAKTKILDLLLHHEQNQGYPIKFNVDIEGRAFEVLNHYEIGFRNLWKEMMHKNENYKSEGMKEMFKVISRELSNAIKA